MHGRMDGVSTKTNDRVYTTAIRVTTLALWRARFSVLQQPQAGFICPSRPRYSLWKLSNAAVTQNEKKRKG